MVGICKSTWFCFRALCRLFVRRVGCFLMKVSDKSVSLAEHSKERAASATDFCGALYLVPFEGRWVFRVEVKGRSYKDLPSMLCRAVAAVSLSAI